MTRTHIQWHGAALWAAKDEDVVHVYDYDSLIYEFSEVVIHHHLECHWAISETKEHD